MRKDRDQCSPKEERFCQLVVYQNVPPRDAALQAGWSESTISSYGPNYVMKRPRVQERIKEMNADVVMQRTGKFKTLSSVFLTVAHHVDDAIQVMVDLMHNAKSEAVKQRAAATIIEAGKGILIAQMPKKVTFDVRMSQLAEEARQRLESGQTIDIDPEEESEDGQDAEDE